MANCHKKTLPEERVFYLSAKCTLLSFSQIRMRSGYCVWTLFACCCCTKINGTTIAAFLAILKDKAIIADAFFFNQVVFNGIYSIPAELLFLLS